MRHRRRTPKRHWGTTLVGGIGLVLAIATAGAVLPGSGAVQAMGASSEPSVSVTTPASAVATLAPPPEPSPAATAEESVIPVPEPSDAAPPTAAPTKQPDAAPATESGAVQPNIAPSPVTRLQIPAIGVDASVRPVDSTPTGKTNAWGGEIYGTIDFPVDSFVRQWVRRGDPNTLSAAQSVGNPKAFDRVLLYGHASDIGNHLVFQDLAALQLGDSIIATTANGTFTYRVTLTTTRVKSNLDNLAELYDYPTPGAKEIALVACLPNTTSNAVAVGTLVAASSL